MKKYMPKVIPFETATLQYLRNRKYIPIRDCFLATTNRTDTPLPAEASPFGLNMSSNRFMFAEQGDNNNCLCQEHFCDDSSEGSGSMSRRTSPSAFDDILAQELNDLSLQEREKVFNEIHGVADGVVETPEMIDEKLKELDECIRKIKKKPAFERALFLSPRYVRDRSFRVMFLRSTFFDATKAANKIVAYFRSKLELFGEEKLVKRLTLDDLDQDTLDELHRGSILWLPVKDRSNRPVLFVVQKNFAYKTWQSKVRGIWYLIMAILEDEDAQMNGIVNIYYSMDIDQTEHNYVALLRGLNHVSMEVYVPIRKLNSTACMENSRGFLTFIFLLQAASSKCIAALYVQQPSNEGCGSIIDDGRCKE